MKKLLVLVLALCLFIPAAAVMAEDDEEISFYTDEVPEAAVYVSTWVAEDGTGALSSLMRTAGSS